MNPRLVGLSLAAVLVIAAASSGLAASGSVYVTSDCTYPSLQDNSLDNDYDVWVWVKQTGDGFGALTWTAVNKLPTGGTATDSGTLIEDACERDDGKYVLYEADSFDNNSLGSWTLTVWDGASSVSSDSFRFFQ